VSYYAHINSGQIKRHFKGAETLIWRGFEGCIYNKSKLKKQLQILLSIFWLFNLADTYLPPKFFTIP
jgi:hypothetical protein